MTKSHGRFALFVVVAAAALFALQGGQYSSIDLLRQHSRITTLKSQIASLKVENDSLDLYRKALNSNARVQERIARELWGMSKAGEIVYKFVDR